MSTLTSPARRMRMPCGDDVGCSDSGSRWLLRASAVSAREAGDLVAFPRCRGLGAPSRHCTLGRDLPIRGTSHARTRLRISGTDVKRWPGAVSPSIIRRKLDDGTPFDDLPGRLAVGRVPKKHPPVGGMRRVAGIKVGRQWRFRSETVQQWLAERHEPGGKEYSVSYQGVTDQLGNNGIYGKQIPRF